MASLTHVSMWSDKNGWEHVTAEQIALSHGYTVSADSKIFMCRLCNQYVSFSPGNVNAPQFRHTSCRESDHCPDKVEGYFTTYLSSCNNDSFPIRVLIHSSSHFSFEIGITIPNIKAIKSKQFTLLTKNERFKYDISRLGYYGFSYLAAGNNPSRWYQIKFDDSEDDIYHAERYSGVRLPCLFDAESRKLLPSNADVIPNHNYLLLTKNKLYYHKDITFERVSELGNLYIYKVSAIKISKEASDFFVEYGAFLTESPIDIIPVWPVYIATPYVIKHNTDYVVFKVNGDYSYPKAFPNYSIRDDKGVIGIYCGSRQQLVTVGHTKVLKYTYILKDQLNRKSKVPRIKVTDEDDKEIQDGKITRLPKNKTLIVFSDYDGKIEIKKNESIVDQKALKAQTRIFIDNRPVR